MVKKDKEKKPPKTLFSEEIDSAINGFAIGFLFISVGLFLLFKPDYFKEPLASYIVGAVIGLVGVMGTGVEFSKATQIKGMDMLSIGAVLLVGWLVQYIYIQKLWANIVFFPVAFVGTYAIFLGLFRAIYSIIYNSRLKATGDDNQLKRVYLGKTISQVVLFLTQLCGLAVAILNVLKASGV